MFKLSQKYIDFVNDFDTRADFLEGTTASGKTTIGAGVKFMLKVSASPKRQHIIAARTTGVAEKNILQQDNGILDIYGDRVEYFGNGDKNTKLPHLKFEDKIIYILGYDNKDKWENVLGSQFGCVLIDEINIADIDFVREISTRNEYLLATLNPDSPDLEVYKEFINCARPLPKYAKDVPSEITKYLTEPEKKNWRYWFFTFRDNAGLTEEDIQRKIESAPVGTKLYKNKILGLRGRATGLIFDLKPKNIITREAALKMPFVTFSIGVDTSYSSKSHDRITLEFVGITVDRKCVLLDEETYNNADIQTPFAPSDVIPLIVRFAEKNKTIGFARTTYIDSADQATITEAKKYQRETASVYQFLGAWKKTKIITRIQLQQSWLNTGDFFIVDTCKAFISECGLYSYDDKGQPEDGHDHSINGCQYAWLPYKLKIGDPEKIKALIKDAYD